MIYSGTGFLEVWLLAHSLTLLPAISSNGDKLLTGEGRKAVDEEPNHTTARKPGQL